MEKNFKEDAVDITKIYEIIKDKGFIQDLWLDVLSDLKEKASYLQLKNMVEKVIETPVKNYATKPIDHEEGLKTRTTYTDIGFMTYTIDTLISDVLKKKLKDELQSMISKVIDDDKDSKKSSNADNKSKKVTTMLEDIGKLLCSSDKNNKPNKSEGSTSSQEDLNRSLYKSVATNKPAARKEKRLKTSEQKTSFVANGSHKKTSNIINSTARSPSKRIKNINKKSSIILDDENSDVDVTKVSDDEDFHPFHQKNHSIRHTSDFSSFKDDISISSQDEKDVKCKKRVSLKLDSPCQRSSHSKKLLYSVKKSVLEQKNDDNDDNDCSDDNGNNDDNDNNECYDPSYIKDCNFKDVKLMDCEVRITDIKTLLKSRECRNNFVFKLNQTVLEENSIKHEPTEENSIKHEPTDISIEIVNENSIESSFYSQNKTHSQSSARNIVITKETNKEILIPATDALYARNVELCKNIFDSSSSHDYVDSKQCDKKLVNRQHKVLFASDKLEILKKMNEGISVNTICEQYGVGNSTIYDLKKRRDQARKALKKYPETSIANENVIKSVSNPLEKALLEFCQQCRKEGIYISSSVLMHQAKVLHSQLSVKTVCKYSKKKWLSNFKEKYGKFVFKKLY